MKKKFTNILLAASALTILHSESANATLSGRAHVAFANALNASNKLTNQAKRAASQATQQGLISTTVSSSQTGRHTGRTTHSQTHNNPTLIPLGQDLFKGHNSNLHISQSSLLKDSPIKNTAQFSTITSTTAFLGNSTNSSAVLGSHSISNILSQSTEEPTTVHPQIARELWTLANPDTKGFRNILNPHADVLNIETSILGLPTFQKQGSSSDTQPTTTIKQTTEADKEPSKGNKLASNKKAYTGNPNADMRLQVVSNMIAVNSAPQETALVPFTSHSQEVEVPSFSNSPTSSKATLFITQEGLEFLANISNSNHDPVIHALATKAATALSNNANGIVEITLTAKESKALAKLAPKAIEGSVNQKAITHEVEKNSPVVTALAAAPYTLEVKASNEHIQGNESLMKAQVAELDQLYNNKSKDDVTTLNTGDLLPTGASSANHNMDNNVVDSIPNLPEPAIFTNNDLSLAMKSSNLSNLDNLEPQSSTPIALSQTTNNEHLIIGNLFDFEDDEEQQPTPSAAHTQADNNEENLVIGSLFDTDDEEGQPTILATPTQASKDTSSETDLQVAAPDTATQTNEECEDTPPPAAGNQAPFNNSVSGGSNPPPVTPEIVSTSSKQELPNIALATAETLKETNHVVQERMIQVAKAHNNIGIAAGNGDAIYGAWLKVIGSKGKQKASKYDSNKLGFNINSTGFIIGADSGINEVLILGASYAFTNSHVKYKSPFIKSNKDGDKISIENHIIAVYGIFNATDKIFISGQLNGGIGRKAKVTDKDKNGNLYTGNTKDTLWGGNVAIGYNINLGDSTILTPTLGFNHRNVKVSRTTLLDTSKQYRNVDSYKSSRSAYNLGLGLQKSFDIDGTKVMPEAHIGFERTINSRNNAPLVMFNSEYSGIVTTKETTSEKNTLNAGSSIMFSSNKKTEISLGYDFTHRKKFKGHTGFIKARLNF